MDDDDSSQLLFVAIWCLILALLAGTFYGGYRWGRKAERKELEPHIVDAIEKAFWQGYDFCEQKEAIQRERREATGA